MGFLDFLSLSLSLSLSRLSLLFSRLDGDQFLHRANEREFILVGQHVFMFRSPQKNIAYKFVLTPSYTLPVV